MSNVSTLLLDNAFKPATPPNNWLIFDKRYMAYKKLCHFLGHLYVIRGMFYYSSKIITVSVL